MVRDGRHHGHTRCRRGSRPPGDARPAQGAPRVPRGGRRRRLLRSAARDHGGLARPLPAPARGPGAARGRSRGRTPGSLRGHGPRHRRDTRAQSRRRGVVHHDRRRPRPQPLRTGSGRGRGPRYPCTQRRFRLHSGGPGGSGAGLFAGTAPGSAAHRPAPRCRGPSGRQSRPGAEARPRRPRAEFHRTLRRGDHRGEPRRHGLAHVHDPRAPARPRRRPVDRRTDHQSAHRRDVRTVAPVRLDRRPRRPGPGHPRGAGPPGRGPSDRVARFRFGVLGDGQPDPAGSRLVRVRGVGVRPARRSRGRLRTRPRAGLLGPRHESGRCAGRCRRGPCPRPAGYSGLGGATAVLVAAALVWTVARLPSSRTRTPVPA